MTKSKCLAALAVCGKPISAQSNVEDLRPNKKGMFSKRALEKLFGKAQRSLQIDTPSLLVYVVPRDGSYEPTLCMSTRVL